MQVFKEAKPVKVDKVRKRDVVALATSIGFLLFAMGISATSYQLLKNSSNALDNHARVEEQSQLEYYLTVKSDGVDKYGNVSSENATANINGGLVTVKDKIPEGLEFVGFKTTDTGTIGAIARSDAGIACAGHVIDDTKEDGTDSGVWNATNTEYTYHGLHYDATTRTVSFRAEGIQAGCDLTVGVITKTPALGDEVRKDFYNTASLNEGVLSLNSNTVHVWMGRESATTYDVSYAYTGTVPDNAPTAPETQSFVEGASVGVATSPQVEGYQFSGWQTNDVAVSAGTFEMPAGNVAFTGSFVEKPVATKYKVTYEIDGDAPADFMPPREREYEAGANVALDGTTSGFMVDDYSFDGWTSEDVTLEGANFTMPAKNVTITGSFTRQTYEVKYLFEGDVKPENYEALLPETKEYPAGTTVTLADNPTAEGYEFTGWYKSETFTMPAENVTIYGEWVVVTGSFKPEIAIKMARAQEKYKAGETVEFEISVKNTAEYAISEVQVLENLEGAVFVAGDGYVLKGDDFAMIETIPASETVVLKASYVVPEGAEGTVVNEVELVGAIADGNYRLDTSEEYKASVEFATVEYSDDEEPTDEPTDEQKDEEEETADNTNTLDTIIRYTTLGTLALIGMIVGLVVMMRNNVKGDEDAEA